RHSQEFLQRFPGLAVSLQLEIGESKIVDCARFVSGIVVFPEQAKVRWGVGKLPRFEVNHTQSIKSAGVLGTQRQRLPGKSGGGRCVTSLMGSLRFANQFIGFIVIQLAPLQSLAKLQLAESFLSFLL